MKESASTWVARVVLGWEQPTVVLVEREVTSNELVGIVVEVVLNSDLVQVHVGVGGAVVGLEVDLVIQAVDIQQITFDIREAAATP